MAFKRLRLPDLLVAVLAVTFAATGGSAACAAEMAGAVLPGTQCGQDGAAAFQILGSGGPLNGRGRASTSYLLWLSSRPALMVDVGSGAMVNFARTRAEISELDVLLITHIHPDHVSDLPELLWSADVADRKRPLKIVGPDGRGSFPDINTFLARLLGSDGAFAFMQALLDPKSPFHLDVTTLDTSVARPLPAYEADDVRVTAYPVPHGRAPAVAFRIEGRGFNLVVAGDQSGADPDFAVFAHEADLLVLHAALGPSGGDHAFAQVIGTPQRLGRLAEKAHVKRVILSHLMAFPTGHPDARKFSLSDPAALLRAFRAVYRGKVSIARDLQCVKLAGP